MKTTEKLAILTALQKAVKEQLDITRAEAEEEMRTAYLEDGVDRKTLMLDGKKVGTLTATKYKDDFAIIDKESFEEFALTYGFAEERTSIRPEYTKSIIEILKTLDPEAYKDMIKTDVVISQDWKNFMTMNPAGVVTFLDTTEVVPGVDFVPESYKGIMVKDCKPAVVVPILQQIGGIDQLLLGGGE